MRECHTKLLGMALSQIEKNRLSGISTFLKKTNKIHFIQLQIEKQGLFI